MDKKTVLGGVAAVILAATGLLTFLYQSHLFPFSAAPSPTPTTSTSTSFHVIEAIVRADPFNFSGVCPVTITFSGRISAVGAGTVSYRFIRSDGASAPIETLTFNGSGSQDVTETWRLGGPAFTFSGWEAIRVIDPTALDSAHATFRIVCT